MNSIGWSEGFFFFFLFNWNWYFGLYKMDFFLLWCVVELEPDDVLMKELERPTIPELVEETQSGRCFASEALLTSYSLSALLHHFARPTSVADGPSGPAATTRQ